VRVGDVRLGGYGITEAAALIDADWDQPTLSVSDGDRTWEATPSEFGIQMNAVATAQAALNVGHGGSFFGEFSTLIETMLGGYEVQPVVTVDPVLARTGLERWASIIALPPQNATIAIQGDQVVSVPGKQGLSLDVEGSLALLTANPGAALADGRVPLSLVAVAPAVGDVSAILADAERLLALPLVIEVYDPITDARTTLTPTRSEMAGWLGVDDSAVVPAIIVDVDRIRDTVNAIDRDLGEGRSVNAVESAALIQAAMGAGGKATLIVEHAPTTYVVQPGDTLIRVSWAVGMPYWRILEANPGLDQDNLSVGQTLTIPSQNDLLPLPVVPDKRIRVSISDQRMWLYEDGAEVANFVISTGIDRSPTQPGIFQVQTFDEYAYASIWDLYMPDFIGIYEAWPGFMNGFHGLPTLSSGNILWADVLGSPASYGCIILTLENSQQLWDWSEPGVVVEIVE
jgi:LysM repeat protein